MIALFDSHCHLQNVKFAGDVSAVIARAREAGVRRILNLGTRLESSREVIALAREYPECLAAIGVHPGDLDAWCPDEEAGLMELAREPEVVVYGEIGLDYYWKHFDHETQRRIFRRQLAMARELGLPVSIHCREAYEDMIPDLRAENGAAIGGVAHCFTGTLEQARELTELGFYLGVGGSSTYPASGALRATLKEIGSERLLLETDAPYLPPQPARGKRNEPAFVAHTAEAIAPLFEMTAAGFALQCWRNTEVAFRLEPALV